MRVLAGAKLERSDFFWVSDGCDRLKRERRRVELGAAEGRATINRDGREALSTFPTLAEPVTVPATKLARSTLEENQLDDALYVVLEPTNGGVTVRAATVDEELAYEREHGTTRIYRSSEEFLDALERVFEDE